jgi:ABC-2 type transport system ATP-binding protein
MRRRLDLAGALIAHPRCCSSTSRRPGSTRAAGSTVAVIREPGRERRTTLLLTTQYLEEADELADSIAVVDHGSVIARGTADELKAKVGGERIEVVVHDSPSATPWSWPSAT